MIITIAPNQELSFTRSEWIWVLTTNGRVYEEHRVNYQVRLGLHCVRCGEPATFIHFWRQHIGRHLQRGQMPVCGPHAIEEAMSVNWYDNQHLYRPEDGDPFVTWLEVSLSVLQMYFIGKLS